MTYAKPALCGIAILLLSACNSGGGGTMSTSSPTAEMAASGAAETSPAETVTAEVDPNLPNTFTPSEAAQSAIARLFKANASGVNRLQSAASVPTSRVPIELSAQTNASGDIEWSVTLKGQTYVFGPGDLSSRGDYYTKPADSSSPQDVFVITEGDTWSAINSGNPKYRYVVPLRIFLRNPNTSESFDYYSTFGMTTPSSDIPVSGTATFLGDVHGLERTTQPSGAMVFLNGDIELNVDFANARVSGDMRNFASSTGASIPGTLLINPTDIVNGAFSSDLTLTGAGTATFSRSAINGRLYGDEADQTGGDFSYITRVNGVDTAVGVGAFVGKR